MTALSGGEQLDGELSSMNSVLERPDARAGDALRNGLQSILFHQFSSASRPLFSSRKRSKTEPIKSTSAAPIGVDRQAAAPFGRLIPAA